MATLKEFQRVKDKSGLHVWRVEKMELVQVASSEHGKFFTGDCYILLNNCPPNSVNVHSWTGAKASQDEMGAAAIYMTQLDDFLGGVPVQFTEFQDMESSTFLNYFRRGVTYKAGGVASGFKHVVDEDALIKRLLHVKGRRRVRSREVDLSWKSFNSDDSFIIDFGKIIYIWSGKGCNMFERLKATEVANDIRDNERKGRAEVIRVDEGEEPDAVTVVLGPKPDTLTESSHSDETCTHKPASLYLISDATGDMSCSLVAEKAPFEQDQLSSSECYILDNGGKTIYVWKGPAASKDERKAAVQAARWFIQKWKYPARTQVQVLPAGAESALFKQFFSNWLDKDETTCPGQGYSRSNIARVEQTPFDASKLHENKSMAAQHGMPDDGSGDVKIWRVEASDKVEVDPRTYGQFYGGDCYLVLYTYKQGRNKRHIIYTWQGQKCSVDELAASALLTIALDDSMDGMATQVRVPQGQEPPHLVSLFKKSPLVIHQGGTSRSDGQSQPGSTRLFHIRLSSTNGTRAVEVEPAAPSLNTNDTFVLKTPKSLCIWKGKGAHEEEMSAAKYVAKLLGGTVTEVDEGNEPDCFWSALGGKSEYQTSKSLQRTVNPPRLFGCSNKTGRLIAEEVPPEFTQGDLAPDDVMILDTWDQLFVWVGKDANETEKKGAEKIADDYVASDPCNRRIPPITIMKQGEELLSFTGWFHAWDPSMWGCDQQQR